MIDVILKSMLIIFGIIAVVIDIKSRKIPNLLILLMLCGWALIIIIQVFISIEIAVIFFSESLLGFVIGGGVSLLVYIISKKGLGGGDVKFLAVAGLYLGIYGILPAMLIGSILAGLTGIGLILIKKIKKKDSIPLAPFLCIGIIATVVIL
ncbi:MAG: A24 family peptidase [Oscillospiraceae bacterium]|jgi:leader peptidase (prepilin peptidase)/N-methyltransferase|nr:A24 family peptidase [Oscillospiraceae bacterium]